MRKELNEKVSEKYKVAFMVGLVESEETSVKIQEEHDVHRDILQVSIIDNYKNLSYKTLSSCNGRGR